MTDHAHGKEIERYHYGCVGIAIVNVRMRGYTYSFQQFF